ncbi:hypothetical protein BOTBODRAFT_171331 [Botryobasidium botryosum FD-172 SS1]|uniref:Kinetochore protein Spc24 n=1 Tax=Botryobasidium botryosum (strain FD-172 SS1) TaxID=930990 RepID=A0A067MSC6_BOTB1|nr:hypothetical protein BOTBODRAFT_171331 [Botryobasidium botryosum FD-172 SS1]
MSTSPQDVNEVIKILKQVKVLTDPTQDLHNVALAQQHMQATEATRAAETEQIQLELRALSQRLAAARSSATRPASVPSAAQHSNTMKELDGMKFGVLKGMQEAEEIQASREAEVSKLREELKMLEATDVTDEVGLDGVALRLKICKDLGFDVVTDKATGEGKMIVRSESNEVYVVGFDDGKTDFQYSNHLWELSSS